MKKLLLKIVPWCLLSLFVVEVVAILIPKPDKDFNIQEFGRLPVLLNGRIQPLDSVGRNALLQIRNTASVPLEEKKSYEFWKHPRKLKASEWIMEVFMKPEVADTRPIFLIHHPELLDSFDLRGKGVEKSGLFYFSYNQLSNSLERIEAEGRQVQELEGQQRTAFQKQLSNLYNALALYQRLKNSLKPESMTDFAGQLARFQASIGPGVEAVRSQQGKEQFDQAAFDTYLGYIRQFEAMNRLAYPLIVPKANPENVNEDWHDMGQVLFEAGIRGGEVPPAVGWYARMASAYEQGKPDAFNAALTEYRDWLTGKFLGQVSKGRAEVFFNNLQSFLHAMIMYLFAFVLAAIAMVSISVWPNGSEMLRRSAFYITVLALVVHTAGLVFRMWLERRPPVTNLYSSAIFIGWMAVLLGVILERIYRVGIGVAAASLVGAITLIIAHNLSFSGDTMEMMRAVLDSNFWLATHVVTITLGYAAMFMAGFLAILYILLGLFTPLLSRPLKATGAPGDGVSVGQGSTIAQALGKMVYGIICFATLFSFVGTVLGGIWADQSWGRFWGWDPKENGALLIVIWCAVILHARWGGMVRERGLMNLALVGNIVTAWSWFGVNMLGVGLHSYGFMDSAFIWLVIFVASQIALICISFLPVKCWRSFKQVGVMPAIPAD
jgi:cytochrome c-type biogenesis protein CcsB